jgi:3-hydroxyisobutyrate dehydrogenase-like beta-hydroxyacid dehydrogenase
MASISVGEEHLVADDENPGPRGKHDSVCATQTVALIDKQQLGQAATSTTLFKLDHMLKDVRLCLEEGQTVGAPFPFAALTREILSTAAGMGYGEADFAALIEALEAAAGTKL